jgi:hypothetical protein
LRGNTSTDELVNKVLSAIEERRRDKKTGLCNLIKQRDVKGKPLCKPAFLQI